MGLPGRIKPFGGAAEFVDFLGDKALVEDAPPRLDHILAVTTGSLRFVEEALIGRGDNRGAVHGADRGRLAADQPGLGRSRPGLAEQLGDAANRLQGLIGEPAEDVGWARSRLERLDTRERAGETIDPDERNRLQAALDRHAEAEAERADLESQLTVLRARLLEIAATARRA